MYPLLIFNSSNFFWCITATLCAQSNGKHLRNWNLGSPQRMMHQFNYALTLERWISIHGTISAHETVTLSSHTKMAPKRTHSTCTKRKWRNIGLRGWSACKNSGFERETEPYRTQSEQWYNHTFCSTCVNNRFLNKLVPNETHTGNGQIWNMMIIALICASLINKVINDKGSIVLAQNVWAIYFKHVNCIRTTSPAIGLVSGSGFYLRFAIPANTATIIFVK